MARGCSWILGCLLLWGQATWAADASQTVLHALDYVAVDYPGVIQNGQVLDQDEYSEQHEFVLQVRKLIAEAPSVEQKPALQQRADQLVAAIEAKRPGEEVKQMCAQLASAFITAYHIAVSPAKTPSPMLGETLYQRNCKGCHGVEGFGDGPAGKGLTPPPINFHERERQEQRNIYSLYSTISLGVSGTKMRPFTELSDEERWALAFYVSHFLFSAEERSSGEQLWQNGKGRTMVASLANLTQASPESIRQQYGDDGVAVLAYLRQHPDVLPHAQTQSSAPLDIAKNKLANSLDEYRAGHVDAAYNLAVNAYLEGFELAESGLRVSAPELKTTIEQKMSAFRQAIRDRVSVNDLSVQLLELNHLLADADTKIREKEFSPTAAMGSALVILLREGVEAILVLAALVAFLTKIGRRSDVRYIHLGWIAALALGGVTWVAAKYLVTFSGASRELTEGVMALVGAAMLIYVGFWLHSHSNAKRWKGFIHDQVSNVLDKGTMWSLVLVSFIAVYREVFETVLFYETLWWQVDEGGRGFVMAGFAVAAALLVLISWLLFRYSVRLPLALFFRVNAALLFVLAVVFAGKGVAVLQEAGKLAVNPLNVPQVEFLGVYPTLQGVGLQLLLLVVAGGWLLYSRFQNQLQSSAK